jgi:hypothetical protein
MPTVSRFHGIVIAMYFDDHLPPHFHAIAAGREALIRISPIEVLTSNLPRGQLRMVCKWALLHRPELEENWQLAQDGGTLVPIEPWR